MRQVASLLQLAEVWPSLGLALRDSPAAPVAAAAAAAALARWRR